MTNVSIHVSTKVDGKFPIVRDAKSLNSGISKTAKMGEAYHDAIHVLAVSTLVHAAEGGIQPLNSFFNILPINYQTAFRLYVSRFQTVMVEGKAKPSDMKFLSYNKDKGFALVNKTPDERAAFVKHAEDNLINPDGKDHKRFYEREIVAETKLFNPTDLLSAINGLIKKSSGEVEKYETHVPEPMIAVLENARTSIERLMAPAQNTMH